MKQNTTAIGFSSFTPFGRSENAQSYCLIQLKFGSKWFVLGKAIDIAIITFKLQSWK